MMNRRLLFLLLAFLFAFAQQQALAHPYVHITEQQKSSDSSKKTQHHETCGQCIALASLDATACSKISFAVLLTPNLIFQYIASHDFVETGNFVYRSRAPPTLV